MKNSELELNTFSLEEQEKIASSVEDIYGYQVLTEEFQERIDNYDEVKKQERQEYMDYVFLGKNNDDIMLSFQNVMETNMNTIVREEYVTDEIKGDSPLLVGGFTILGALITGVLWIVIEKQKKRKDAI